jgi:hypothetical protein
MFGCFQSSLVLKVRSRGSNFKRWSILKMSHSYRYVQIEFGYSFRTLFWGSETTEYL